MVAAKRSPAGSLSLKRNSVVQNQRIKKGKNRSFLGINDLVKFGDAQNDVNSSIISGQSNLSDVVERVQNSLFVPQQSILPKTVQQMSRQDHKEDPQIVQATMAKVASTRRVDITLDTQNKNKTQAHSLQNSMRKNINVQRLPDYQKSPLYFDNQRQADNSFNKVISSAREFDSQAWFRDDQVPDRYIHVSPALGSQKIQQFSWNRNIQTQRVSNASQLRSPNRSNNFKVPNEIARQHNASETRSVSSLKSLKEERAKMKMLSKQADITAKQSIDQNPLADAQARGLSTDQLLFPLQGLGNRGKIRAVTMSCSSLQEARAKGRKDSKQRLSESQQRVEQIERDWNQLKQTLKPADTLPILKEVNEEAKRHNKKLKQPQDQRQQIKKICKSTNHSPKLQHSPQAQTASQIIHVGTINFKLPQGFSSDERVQEGRKEEQLSLKNNSTGLKTEKQRNLMIAQSPTGISQHNFYLDCIMEERHREQQPQPSSGVSSQHKSNEVHGPSSTKYRQAKTGTHKAVKNKASVKQPAIKPKSIKNYQSSEKKNSQASGSMDQLTNKYQTSVSSNTANVVAVHQNHPKPSKAEVTAASKREPIGDFTKMTKNYEIIKEPLGKKFSQPKKPMIQPNAIMVKQPTMQPGQELNSATISHVRETITVQSDSSSNIGAKIPIRTTIMNQKTSMSAREQDAKHTKRAKKANPNRSQSSNSESMVDDNVQEGTAANQPIQKTQLKVSVVSRKRTNTYQHIVQEPKPNRETSTSLMQIKKLSSLPIAEDRIDSHSQSLVVIAKNSEPIKTKQVISLALKPQHQKHGDIELNQDQRHKVQKSPLVTNLLQSVIKMPSLTQFHSKPLSGQTKRKKPKEPSLKSPTSQVSIPSRNNPMKIQKRQMNKDSLIKRLDEDSLQISAPHATKSFKNISQLLSSSSKVDSVMATDSFTNVNQIAPSQSQHVLHTYKEAVQQESVSSFSQIPTKQKEQKQPEIEVVKVTYNELRTQNRSREQSKSKTTQPPAQKQSHQFFVNRRVSERQKKEQNSATSNGKVAGHACIDLTLGEPAVVKSQNNSQQNLSDKVPKRAKVESCLSVKQQELKPKPFEIYQKDIDQSTLSQKDMTPKLRTNKAKKQESQSFVIQQSPATLAAQKSLNGSKGQQKHNSRKQPVQNVAGRAMVKKPTKKNSMILSSQLVPSSRKVTGPELTVSKPPMIKQSTSRRTSPSAMAYSERPNSRIQDYAPKGKISKQADVIQPCAPQEMSLSQSLADGEWLDSDMDKEEHPYKKQQKANDDIFNDDIVDPFKKRVNPNFQASQIPSYDWTAPEQEPINSRGSSITRERQNSPRTQTFSKNTSRRNSNFAENFEIQLRRADEGGQVQVLDSQEVKPGKNIMTKRETLSKAVQEAKLDQQCGSNSRRSVDPSEDQPFPKTSMKGDDEPRSPPQLRASLNSVQLYPRTMQSPFHGNADLDETPPHDYTGDSAYGGDGRQKIHEHLESIYTELRLKKNDYESNQPSASEEVSVRDAYASNAPVATQSMEESKASTIQQSEPPKFKKHQETEPMVELPNSYSQFIQLPPAEMNVGQPTLNQTMPVPLQLSQTQPFQVVPQGVQYIQPPYQQQQQQYQPNQQYQPIPVQFLQQNQPYALLVPASTQQQPPVMLQPQPIQQPYAVPNQPYYYMPPPQIQQQPQAGQQPYMLVLPQQQQQPRPPH